MAYIGTHAPFLLTACNHHDKENSGFTLYSISNKIHHEFDDPFLHKKLFVGSQYGWVTVLGLHCEPTFLNPLTGESIPLPSITTIPRVRPNHSVNGDIVSYFCRTTYRPESRFEDHAFDHCLISEVTLKKVLISSNPSTSSNNFFAAALVGYDSKLVVARPGVSRWNLLQEENWYMDIKFCHDRKLICLTDEGAIHEVQLKDDDFVITEMAAPFFKDNTDLNMYLAEDCAGSILVIIRRYEFITRLETSDVKVFRLTGGCRKENKWERVKSLDGQAIFVGTNASISLSKQDICGDIKEDTIYFTDEWWSLMGGDEQRISPRDICAYNLISNSIKPCCPYEHRQCTWPLPVWIQLLSPNQFLT
ncbi:hypothetical protein LUZ61_007523 [Rhynchospora tenuis]|uniref:KIB1-4 beta-propeller domain-containing protein n=1 Tax=Rhynchospora tenuis TaxID=198213 RepID=A0AAD5ZTQ8_9POAL|nr:hypothetical protein LUZ61_007523 [Rhynchospora tenuis]